jgi:hypothetical protein
VIVGCGSALIERMTNVVIDRGRLTSWFPGWDHDSLSSVGGFGNLEPEWDVS